jgi:tetratricopeptide (TPR) repeat protein
MNYEQFDDWIYQLFQNRNQNTLKHFLTNIECKFNYLYSDESNDIFSSVRENLIHIISSCKLSDLKQILKFNQVLIEYCDLTQNWELWLEWIRQQNKNRSIDDINELWMLYGNGRYWEEVGQFDRSLKYHKKGIQKGIQNTLYISHTPLAMNYLGAGITLQRCEQYQDSEWHLEKALAIFRENQHKNFINKFEQYQEANVLMNLGSLYDRMGQFNLSIFNYTKSIDLLKNINNKFDIGRVFYSLGIVYIKTNQLSKAERTFRQGQSLLESSQNYHFLSLNLYGLSWLEYIKGNISKSCFYIQESMDIFQRESEIISFAESEGNIYTLAAAIYSKKGNYEVALIYLNLAESKYRKIDSNNRLMTKVLANRARILFDCGNTEKSVKIFWKLFHKGKQLNSYLISGDAVIHILRIYLVSFSSFQEWYSLLKHLKIYGIYSLILALISRLKRYFGRYKHLMKTIFHNRKH